MARPIITFTTDFGTGSPYVAQMKGVILSIHREVEMVDITHQVTPQDVRQAALVLEQVSPCFPEGTVHICVVDPGVGTDRQIVLAQIETQFFIAPDNGVLSRMVSRAAPRRIIALTNVEAWLHPVSNTFHGRDIMAPVAARFVSGATWQSLGTPVQQLQTLDWPEPQLDGQQLCGQVLYADSFGNLITNIRREWLDRLGAPAGLFVSCAGRTIRGIVATYGLASAGSLVALVGSNGLLEIAVVQGNAAQVLGIEPGQRVMVSREDTGEENTGSGKASRSQSDGASTSFVAD
jgi:S-adenosylmethionine hydrolase